MRNILFIINSLRLGGMERQLVEMIKALDNHSYSIHLATFSKEGPFIEEVSRSLSKSIFFLNRKKIKYLSTSARLFQIMKSNRIQLIHIMDSYSALYAIVPAKLLRIPIINGMIRHAGVTQKWFHYKLEKALLNASNVIISNTRSGLEFYKVRGEVLYNIIQQDRFKKNHSDLNSIIIIANFHQYKDHYTFVMAMKELFYQNRVKRIGFIGDGPKKQQYETLITELGMSEITHFYGHTNKVEEILRDYGIGVLCSTIKYQEGLSNAILEYMGSGLIAVASDIGGTGEVISDTVNGYLFEPENYSSLAQKIIFIQDNPHLSEELKHNALKHLTDNHNPEKNIAKYIEIVNNTLN